MEQELMESKRKRVAIVGAGPAGCICAYFVSKNNDVTLFDFKPALHTLLYTGGGRCNLAYEEYNFKELAKNYPRGEKFLYSVFSQFSTGDTIDFFNNIGVNTYTQEDFRIFPESNSAKDVREKLLKALKSCSLKYEKVLNIKKTDIEFEVITQNKSYYFDKVVISVGGHAGFTLAETLGHTIIQPKPALTGLISEQNFSSLQGVSLKNIEATVYFQEEKPLIIDGDILFTHNGITGPLTYKISSIFARYDYNKTNPLKIKLKLANIKEKEFQDLLNTSAKKDIKNLISEFVPKSLAEYITKACPSSDLKCHEINKEKRTLILSMLNTFEINIVSPAKEGEIVTSGGVSLDEINPKTMQSKIFKNLYFCGEVIDVDGFCGGFNLQNCWSTGFIAGNNY